MTTWRVITLALALHAVEVQAGRQVVRVDDEGTALPGVEAVIEERLDALAEDVAQFYAHLSAPGAPPR